VWLSATYTPVVMDGLVVKVVNFALDVTDQKLCSAAFQCLLEAIGRTQAVVTFSLEGLVTDTNELFSQILGYPREFVVGAALRKFVGGEEVATYNEIWQAVCQGHPRRGEFKLIGKGRREVYLLASFTPIVVERKPIKVVLFGHDVTDEKLRDADVQGQIAAISRTQLVLTLSPEGTVVDANELFLKAFGYRCVLLRKRVDSAIACFDLVSRIFS
jgi:methyl-accepting chemotaxis protein